MAGVVIDDWGLLVPPPSRTCWCFRLCDQAVARTSAESIALAAACPRISGSQTHRRRPGSAPAGSRVMLRQAMVFPALRPGGRKDFRGVDCVSRGMPADQWVSDAPQAPRFRARRLARNAAAGHVLVRGREQKMATIANAVLRCICYPRRLAVFGAHIIARHYRTVFPTGGEGRQLRRLAPERSPWTSTTSEYARRRGQTERRS